MKHLKKINEYNSINSDFEDIKEIFLEYAEKYGLYKEIGDVKNKRYSLYIDRNGSISLNIMVYDDFYETPSDAIGEGFEEDIVIFIKRVNLLGFKHTIEWIGGYFYILTFYPI